MLVLKITLEKLHMTFVWTKNVKTCLKNMNKKDKAITNTLEEIFLYH